MHNTILENISLKPYNTFDIDVKAKHFVSVKTTEELKSVLTLKDYPEKFIIGGGSNILLTKDVKALVIREKAFGSEHPDVAASLSNLGVFYRTLAQYDKAEPFFKKALSILVKAVGENHPDTAMVIANLAVLYIRQDRHVEAETLVNRALATCEKVYGTEAPNTSLVMSILAEVLEPLGQVVFTDPAADPRDY